MIVEREGGDIFSPDELYTPPTYIYRGSKSRYFPESTVIGSIHNGLDILTQGRYIGFSHIPYCDDAEKNWRRILYDVPYGSVLSVSAVIEDVSVCIPCLEAPDDRIQVITERVAFKSETFGEKTGMTVINSIPYITSGLYDRDSDDVYYSKPMVLLARKSTLNTHEVNQLFRRFNREVPQQNIFNYLLGLMR